MPVRVLLVDFAPFLIVLKCENHFIAGDAERIVSAVTTAGGGLTAGSIEGIFIFGFVTTVLSVVVTDLGLTVGHVELRGAI